MQNKFQTLYCFEINGHGYRVTRGPIWHVCVRDEATDTIYLYLTKPEMAENVEFVKRLTRKKMYGGSTTVDDLMAAYGEGYDDAERQTREEYELAELAEEPEIDDSTPDWADYYPNQSDYIKEIK